MVFFIMNGIDDHIELHHNSEYEIEYYCKSYFKVLDRNDLFKKTFEVGDIK